MITDDERREKYVALIRERFGVAPRRLGWPWDLDEMQREIQAMRARLRREHFFWCPACEIEHAPPIHWG